MSVIEMTTFTVAPEHTQAMLDARPGMVAAFRDDRRGFLAARLVRLDHEHRRAFFFGADRFEAPDGRVFTMRQRPAALSRRALRE